MRCNSARCPSSTAARARWRCSDLRATSWEEGAAKRLRFHSQNYFDEQLARLGRRPGRARAQGGVAVQLTKPGDKKLDLKTELVFPTEHVRRIIAAAREGKTLLQVAVYDGSDTGEKIYDTLTVIGKADRAGRAQAGRRDRRPGGVRAADALAGDDQLFRPRGGREGRRADAGLCHHLRALRERRIARAACSTTATSS